MTEQIKIKIFESRIGSFLRWTHKAIIDILANKLRFFLTTLGILIGTGSVILLINVGVSAKMAIYQTLNALGDNVIYIMYGESDSSDGFSFANPSMFLGGFTLQQALQIENIVENDPNVLYASKRAVQSANLESNYHSGTYTLIVTDADFFKILDFQLLQGRFPTYKDEIIQKPIVVLGKDLAQKLFPRAIPTKNTITINGKTFNVIGVVEFAKDSSMPNDLNLAAFVLYPSVLDLFPNLRFSTVRLSLKDLDYVDALERKLKQQLNIPFSIMTQQELMEQTAVIMNILTLFIAIIAGVSLIVGGIGIMNILLVSVKEKIKEIGLRKAVGATNKAILIMFLIQSLVYNIIGAAVGIFLGIAGSFLISKIGGLPFVVSTKAIFLATGISFAIGIIFGLYPAILASRLSPVEALREE